jgi:hypothetical protein
MSGKIREKATIYIMKMIWEENIVIDLIGTGL